MAEHFVYQQAYGGQWGLSAVIGRVLLGHLSTQRLVQGLSLIKAFAPSTQPPSSGLKMLCIAATGQKLLATLKQYRNTLTAADAHGGDCVAPAGAP